MARIRPGDLTVSGQGEKLYIKRLEKQLEKTARDINIHGNRGLRGLEIMEKMEKQIKNADEIIRKQSEVIKRIQSGRAVRFRGKKVGRELLPELYERRSNVIIERERLSKELSDVLRKTSYSNKENRKSYRKYVKIKSLIGRISKIVKISEYLNYARQILGFLEKEHISEFKSEVLRALPTIHPQIVDYNRAEFNKILRQYIKHSRLSVSEAINKKALNVALKALQKARVKRSLKPTQRAMDALTRAELMKALPDWRKGKEGKTITTLRAIRIFWLRQKGLLGDKETYSKAKHGELKPGNYRGTTYVPEDKEEARVESKKKIRRASGARLGWYKKGFLEIAGMLAPHVPGDKFRYNKSRGVGHAEPARPGVQPFAIMYHKAPWARRAAAQAASEALIIEAQDMAQYVRRKLKSDVFASEPVARVEQVSALSRKE